MSNERDHAPLPASSSARWMGCPGSYRMAKKFIETSSVNAEEGTLAHELAAFEIENRNAAKTAKAYKDGLANIKKKVDAFYAENTDLDGDFAYMAQTLEPYVDYVAREYQEALDKDESAVLMTEQRVDFSGYVPDGFGTSDVVIIGGGRVTVIDLKYGKGVAVSAVGNPQIRLYALGAIAAFDLVYDFDTVRMVIYQPRLDSVTEEELSVADLKAWAEQEVKPAAKLALSDNPPYRPGEWCTSHFCPGAGICRARAEYALAIERHSGDDPSILTDAEIGEMLERVDALTDWAKKLKGYALGEMQNGHTIPGWKIVEGRSNRTYTDQDKVAAAVIKAGYKEALIYERSLIGITAMEKLLGGKKKFTEVLGKLVYKPQGSPTLAPESDKRPAFTPNKPEFED